MRTVFRSRVSFKFTALIPGALLLISALATRPLVNYVCGFTRDTFVLRRKNVPLFYREEKPGFARRKKRYSSGIFTNIRIAPPLEPISTSSENLQNNFHNDGLEIIHTNNSRTIERWLASHAPSTKSAQVLGFDLESTAPIVASRQFRRPKQGPSVIQLATTTSSLVIHVASIGNGSAESCPLALRAVLSDTSIIKAGVSIRGDALALHRWSDDHGNKSKQERICLRSRLDLGGLAGGRNATPAGLQRLTTNVLGLHLPKSRKIVLSDWDRRVLTAEQIVYAARDAWTAAAIYETVRVAAREVTGGKDVWSPRAVMQEVIGRERSINEVYGRAEKQKAARKELKKIRQRICCGIHGVGDDSQNQKRLTGMIENALLVQRKEELKRAIIELRPDPIPEFCGNDFGFDW